VDRQLYDFAAGSAPRRSAPTISRTVIDVNRDPSGASLYPGQATTELVPHHHLRRRAAVPDGRRRTRPRSRERRDRLLRSLSRRPRKPSSTGCARSTQGRALRRPFDPLGDSRLFDGELPNFNIGTNSGATCDPALTAAVEAACDARAVQPGVTNGRFKGGWTTRHYGQPEHGVHAIQMELACRGYIDEPDACAHEAQLADALREARAAPMRAALTASSPPAWTSPNRE
jgi:N-formylglutamate deformylase